MFSSGPTLSSPTSEISASASLLNPTATSQSIFQQGFNYLVNLSIPAKAAVAFASIGIIAGSAAAGVLAGGAKPQSSSDLCSYSDYRLPMNVFIPSAYRIDWSPPFSAPFIYTGNVSIDLNITQSVNCVLVHSGSDLDYSSITYTTQSPSSSAPSPITFIKDELNERIILKQSFQAGSQVTLNFAYKAPLRTNNNGLYLSTYKDDTNKVINVTATQFEATAARQAFPCFDEPSYKAVFTLSVANVPLGYTALSNMPNTSVVFDARTMTNKVSFAPTPKLSTYLLALVVGPLISDCGLYNGNVPVCAYGVNRAGTVGKLTFARKVAEKIIPFYESKFQIKLPLPKMDMVAIPDFAAGAMENMGLITYRETALLAAENVSSASELQRVSVVVSHELAHQWFGDLVTMDWWSALWLNEGFATRTEYVGVTYATPQFEIDRQFQSTAYFAAMRADSLADVQQLTAAVTSSAEVESMFSAISYSKGGSLLRMLDSFFATFSSSAYYGGVASYIAAHAYGNAKPTDLWAAFAQASGIPEIAPRMAIYESSPGFALVTASWTDASSETSGQGTLKFTQARFFASPYSQSLGQSSLLYWIPMTFVTSTSSASLQSAITQAYLCSTTSPSCAFTGSTYANTLPYSIATDGVLKLNANGTSYYRVAYPQNVLANLFTSAKQQVASGKAGPLTADDRGQLVDDLFAIIEAAFPAQISRGVNTVLALSSSSQLLNVDTSYEVWTPALYHLGLLYTSYLFPDVPLSSIGDASVSPFSGATGLAVQACLTSFSNYSSSLLTPLLTQLGYFDPTKTINSPVSLQLQASALNAASFFNDPTTKTIAQNLFNAGWDQAPVDFQSAILRSVSRWSVNGDGLWEDLQNQYNDAAARGSSSASRLLGSLSAPFDRALLTKAANFALSQDVRVGDKVSLISGIASNPFGRDIAYKAIKDNWVNGINLFKLYGPGGFDLSTLTRASGTYFVSGDYLNDVKAFFASNPVPGAIHDLSQSLENINAHINFRDVQKESDQVCAWLKSSGW